MAVDLSKFDEQVLHDHNSAWALPQDREVSTLQSNQQHWEYALQLRQDVVMLRKAITEYINKTACVCQMLGYVDIRPPCDRCIMQSLLAATASYEAQP